MYWHPFHSSASNTNVERGAHRSFGVIPGVLKFSVAVTVAIAWLIGSSDCRAAATVTAPTLSASAAEVPQLHYRIVERYDHSGLAFTQGLELADGQLYESSGLYKKSYIARWRLDQTAAISRVHTAPNLFAEGLTVFGDNVYLLTWQTGIGLIFDRTTLRPKGRFSYSGEGWGLTHDTRQLILSDGTNQLRFLDPKSLRTQATLNVTENGQPLINLNELEWIASGALTAQPRLLANIWQTDSIAVIDPQSGKVTARIDLSKLLPQRQRREEEDVLNGIAYDASDNTLLVTGKRWRYLWRIRLLGVLP